MVASRYRPFYSTSLLMLSNFLLPISILLFASGFFPYKPSIPGLAEYEKLEFGPPPTAPFDKLIFVVIDALRSDFVYSKGSGFQFTQSLIRDGSAIPFTAHARSPTVTMPRLKAITTGSIPSFVDLILNINEGDKSSSLASQDTWLAQMKSKNKGKLLLYGDDTWLKLFPGTFDRHDGTSSFFVSDFTEVDNNVTRHISSELQNEDWSLMVLHYLGLDHIGHKSGPRSSYMPGKQQEMDGIVEQIFRALEFKPHLDSTLLVICGDHGMNDAGNHGASSPGETSPALVFISPKLKEISPGYEAPAKPKDEFDYYSMVEQSDILPTLASLMGFPISKNNLGVVIPAFLPFWSRSGDQVQILIRNARQILSIVTAAFGHELFETKSIDPCQLEASEVTELACSWRRINHQAISIATAGSVDPEWLQAISAWIRRSQDLMSNMASNYDMGRIYTGQGGAISAIIFGLVGLIMLGVSQPGLPVPLITLSFSYGPMMFASSYVEEEHHFWYWTSTIWLAYLGIKEFQRRSLVSTPLWFLLAIGALRIIRSWNQTGQKFAGEPDIVKTFLVSNPQSLWLMVILAYILVSSRIIPDLEKIPWILRVVGAATIMATSLSFKLAFTAEDAPELVVGFSQKLLESLPAQSLVNRARLVFGVLAVLSGYALYQARTRGANSFQSQSSSSLIHNLCTVLLMTQSRATNIPLFLLFAMVLQVLQTANLSISEITTSCVLLQYASFFSFGGSNAISSVDLSSAYNGISSFNVVAVGVLTLISNWVGPIYWTSATNLLLQKKYKQGQASAFKIHLILLTLFSSASVSFIMAACTALRTHLFIWTVFSPKYLYCMAWTLGQHLLINAGFGGLLFWLTA